MKQLVKLALVWRLLLPFFQKLLGLLGWLLRPFYPLFSPGYRLWQQFSPFMKNIILGLLITVLLIGLRHGQWVTELEDSSIDWMMKFYRGDLVKEETPPFVILDIDDASYRHWGEPLVTPRDKLLTLIKFAVAGSAKLIIVDIALDRQPYQTGELHPDDLALQQYLAEYENYCRHTDCPAILLTRTFRLPENISAFDPNTPAYYWAQRHTFLDHIVMRSPHLFWASTQFEREYDRLLRRWHLWVPTCTQQVPEIIPSMPLLATTLLLEDKLVNPPPCACRLRHYLNYFLPNCQQPPQKWNDEALRHKPTELMVSKDLVIDLHPTRLSRRILYTIPWYLNPGEQLPTVSGGRDLLTRMSAHIVVEKRASPALLRDSLTIIGGSYLEGRDWHATPLGWMPGTLVLVNSIQSLLQYGVLRPPAIGWVLLFATILIVVTSGLLVTLAQEWRFFCSILLIIAVIPLSLMFFKYGIWLDFAIPWLAIQVRQLFDF